MNPMSDTGQKLCGFPKSERVRLWEYHPSSSKSIKDKDFPTSSYIVIPQF